MTCTLCDRPTFVPQYGYCQKHYRDHVRLARMLPCSEEGCGKPGETKGLCKMHYARLKRTGRLDIDRSTAPYLGTNGYMRVPYSHDHPLANTDGTVYEHRAVLFDAIGYGPHRCHWCETAINWRAGLHVDHLNAVKTDNRRANLVESCQPCNVRRGNKSGSVTHTALPNVLEPIAYVPRPVEPAWLPSRGQ